MKKTDREYAEKLAEKTFEELNPQDGYLPQWARDLSASLYMKAIEENNVPELIELLDEVLKVWNEDGEDGEIKMKTPIAWYRVIRKAEAIKKSKEI
jgi:hypothetical protein